MEKKPHRMLDEGSDENVCGFHFDQRFSKRTKKFARCSEVGQYPDEEKFEDRNIFFKTGVLNLRMCQGNITTVPASLLILRIAPSRMKKWTAWT